MTITLDTLNFLSSPAGERVLARLADEPQLTHDGATLSLLTALRKDLPPDQAGAALELARMRVKARAKFGDDAARMFFTRDALEQASDPLVRKYRTTLIPASTGVEDMCCGIGSDALAFAQAGFTVNGYDLDPLRVEMARLNAGVLGLPIHFNVVDAREWQPQGETVFFDPARREDGKRIYNVEQYEPPLSLINHWGALRVLVKLSPGVDLAQLAAYQAGVSFISVNGDLKEALLIRGYEPNRVAVLLTPDQTHHLYDGKLTVEVRPPRAWLCEPDPSVIRAGCVQTLGAMIDGTLLDETIAYLSSDEKPESVWLRAWKILDWMPFNLKKLRAYLRERNVGTVTVKKRGFPITPEELIPMLKLKGESSLTLVMTRWQGTRIVIVCEDYQP